MTDQLSMPIASGPSFPPDTAVRPADRFMRRLLRVRAIDKKALTGAHRAFRLSLVFTAVRCTVMYLLVPILLPVVSLTSVVAAPIGITLCLIALVNGVVSLRRFWRADHRAKWTYTWFMACVFVVLAVALTFDIRTLVASL